MSFFDLFKRKHNNNSNSVELSVSDDNTENGFTEKAVIFHTGGKRPTKELLESWIGAVCWEDGNKEGSKCYNDGMIPLATIFLKDLEYVPECLSKYALITIFMPKEISFHNLEDCFCIKTYEKLEDLVPCYYTSDMIKPFPLIPEFVEDDSSVFDGGNNYYQHKIGGYPSFCQDEYEFGDGYEYVLQISSDEKAQFNIVDSGNFYFYYNKDKNKWKVHCDFY